MLRVLGRHPVYHSQHFSFFFSEDIFQLELLMASVMLQWLDHRALICRCAPWQPCWLWEDSLPIYLKCRGEPFIHTQQSYLISLLPLAASIYHIDLLSLPVYVANLSFYSGCWHTVMRICTPIFTCRNYIKMCIKVFNHVDFMLLTKSTLRFFHKLNICYKQYLLFMVVYCQYIICIAPNSIHRCLRALEQINGEKTVRKNQLGPKSKQVWQWPGKTHLQEETWSRSRLKRAVIRQRLVGVKSRERGKERKREGKEREREGRGAREKGRSICDLVLVLTGHVWSFMFKKTFKLNPLLNLSPHLPNSHNFVLNKESNVSKSPQCYLKWQICSKSRDGLVIVTLAI